MNEKNLRDILADQFVKTLEENKLPWSAMWANNRPYNAVTGARYKGINNMWLSFISEEKGYKDPRWCTFVQAKNKGWSIKKGAKSEMVEFWSMYDRQQKKTISFTEADDIVKENPERASDMKLISKCYNVFNAEQIDGIPELKVNYNVDIAAVRAQRDVLINKMGLTFQEQGSQAFYRPSDDSITMPPDTLFKNDYYYMSTLLHECGHATGHPSRLDRPLQNMFGSPEYAKEELRAEIASAFTSQALGFGANGTELVAAMDNHKAYIQSWISEIKDKPTELFAAIKDAEKISDYLLDKGKFILPELQVDKAQSLKEKLSATPSGLEKTDVLRKELAI